MNTYIPHKVKLDLTPYNRLKSIASLDSRIADRKNRKALRVSISAFNALLSVYHACTLGGVASTLTSSTNFTARRIKIFDDIKDLNLRWDSYTYTAAFMGESNKMAVLALWHRFKKEPMKLIPSYVSVIKILSACLYYNDGDVAMELLHYLWERLDHTRIDPSSGYPTIPSTMITPPAINPMRVMMKSANESRIYSFVLVTLWKEGRTNDCIETLKLIQRRGFEPTPFMYTMF